MSEPGTTEVDVIKQAEELTPQQRMLEYLDVSLYSWLERDFKQDFTKLIQVDNKHRNPIWAEQLCSMQNKFVSAMYCFRETNEAYAKNDRSDVADIWQTKLTQLIYGDGHSSLRGGLSGNVQSEVKAQLVGAYTTLTLIDTLTRARPSLKGHLKPSRIMTNPADDVHGKVDLSFEFGDKNMTGEKLVRIVQLKAHNGSDIIITPITEENMDYLPGVNNSDARKILQTGRKIQASRPQEQLQILPFVVQVPGMDSPAVQQDVWGRINNDDIISRFKFDTKATGLIPMQTQNL